VKCAEAKRLIGAWSAGAEIDGRRTRLLEEHVLGCPVCRPSYADVLPFILRDASLISTVEAAAGSELNPSRGNESRKVGQAGRILILAIISSLALAVAVITVMIAFNARNRVDAAFSLVAPEALSVKLVGDFEGWDPKGIPLRDDDGDGTWTLILPLHKGKTYHYNFLLNEERLIADPASTLRVPDGFGGESSVLRVE
jgi:hypothetical protein